MLKKSCIKLFIRIRGGDDKNYTKAKKKKNANKFSWTQENFQPTIHNFDDKNSGIKVNVYSQSSIF